MPINPPTQPQTVAIAISPVKAISTLTAIAIVIVSLLWTIMGSYALKIDHDASTERTKVVEDSQAAFVIADNNTQNKLSNVDAKVSDQYSLLSAKVSRVEITVFHMRRDKLLLTPLANMTEPHRDAIRQLERDLLALGENIDKTKFPRQNSF